MLCVGGQSEERKDLGRIISLEGSFSSTPQRETLSMY